MGRDKSEMFQQSGDLLNFAEGLDDFRIQGRCLGRGPRVESAPSSRDMLPEILEVGFVDRRQGILA